MVMPEIGAKYGGRSERIVVGAIAGGTISVMTGGKFANGAMSAAIQAAMMPSSEGSHRSDGNVKKTVITIEAQLEFNALADAYEGAFFDSPELADSKFAEILLPFTERHGLEVGANIIFDSRYVLVDITLGSASRINIPGNALTIYDVHTHPVGGGSFSGALFYRNGKLSAPADGDYGQSWRNGALSFQFRGSKLHVAGSNQSWSFDFVGFRDAGAIARTSGGNVDARQFTRRVK